MILKKIILSSVILTFAKSGVLYDFHIDSSLRGWNVVDDGVMGGRSLGNLSLNEDGHGLFNGYISLRNYGGFSSIRCRARMTDVKNFDYIAIRVYGDNKYYQLRIRSNNKDNHVYVKKFFAKDEWNVIKIPLRSMEPQFRGRKLRMNKFNSNKIVEVGILVGNGVEENFSLLIDYIILD